MAMKRMDEDRVMMERMRARTDMYAAISKGQLVRMRLLHPRARSGKSAQAGQFSNERCCPHCVRFAGLCVPRRQKALHEFGVEDAFAEVFVGEDFLVERDAGFDALHDEL